MSLIRKYGPLTTQQVIQLVDCHNQTDKYASSFCLDSSVIDALKNLHTHYLVLAYSPVSGCWYKTNCASIHLGQTTRYIPVGTLLGGPKVINYKDMHLNSFGVGREYVYIIYSTDVRIEAIINRFEFFPLKVGKTKNIKRRVEQLSESGPNSLTVGAVFSTDKPTELERYIHVELTKLGQFLEIPGRREWFRSNISTVIGIYNDFIREGRGDE